MKLPKINSRNDSGTERGTDEGGNKEGANKEGASKEGSKERGIVTAELAVTTLAAFAVLTMMCWGIYLVVTQLRCVDVAAAVARQAARADAAAVAKAKAGAPTGAAIMIDKRPNLVTVTVRVRARPLGRWMAAVPLEARAQVIPEPAAG
ncbi:MAG TPA: TadE family type IV pilus minor pilin [Propionibacteriaceae bacterium]